MKTLINIILTIAAVFAPAKAMVLASLFLISADLVTGVWASIKSKIPITSAGLKRTVVKAFVYEGAILLGFIAQHYLMADSIPVASIISGYIGIVELTSCLENLNTISGQDLLKAIIQKVSASNPDGPKP